MEFPEFKKGLQYLNAAVQKELQQALERMNQINQLISREVTGNLPWHLRPHKRPENLHELSFRAQIRMALKVYHRPTTPREVGQLLGHWGVTKRGRTSLGNLVGSELSRGIPGIRKVDRGLYVYDGLPLEKTDGET